MHLLEAGFRNPLAGVKNLDPDNLVLFVEIENDTRLYLFGFDYLRIIKAEINRVRFLIKNELS